MRKTAADIPLLEADHAPIFARPYLQGGASPLAAVLAHVPELLEATMPFVSSVLGPSHLGDRLKHIVVLRTSVVNGCRYCTRVYRAASEEAGISGLESAILCASEPDTSGFTKRERAAIAFVNAFCREPTPSVSMLKEDFRDDEIVALAAIAGTTLFLNRFSGAMGLL